MNGKNKCKILKEIRREIARNNDIEFVTSDCTFQGDCTGTCPKCEAELRYLEQELGKRQRTGKAVAVAGIAAALVVTATGCSPITDLFQPQPTMGDVPAPQEQTPPVELEDGVMGGLVAFSQEQEAPTPKTLSSTPALEEEPLMGDIAYIPDVVPGEVPDPS